MCVQRGEDAEFGLPREDGDLVPIGDALHRTPWLDIKHGVHMRLRKPTELGR
jgi:hypothetical protein